MTTLNREEMIEAMRDAIRECDGGSEPEVFAEAALEALLGSLMTGFAGSPPSDKQAAEYYKELLTLKRE